MEEGPGGPAAGDGGHRDGGDLDQGSDKFVLLISSVKVACLGLTRKHLGLTLAQMAPQLNSLAAKYGVNVCGEGGEFETFTLNCPIFR